MAQSITDLLMPEVSPGKFLCWTWRWSRHAYLIDAKTKALLNRLSWVVAGFSFAVLFAASLASSILDVRGFEIGAFVAIGAALPLYFMICSKLVQRGERVELASIDPKHLKAPSAYRLYSAMFSFGTWPKWLLAILAILYGIPLLAVLLVIPFLGMIGDSALPAGVIVKLGIVLVLLLLVYWRLLAALFSNENKLPPQVD